MLHFDSFRLLLKGTFVKLRSQHSPIEIAYNIHHTPQNRKIDIFFQKAQTALPLF